MYLDKEKKVEIFSQYGKGATDTGSAEAQIALFTYRIKHLTEHLKKNHKDFGTERHQPLPCYREGSRPA